MLCPFKSNSNTIELTLHTSCYCIGVNIIFDSYHFRIRDILIDNFGEKNVQSLLDESATFEHQMLTDQVFYKNLEYIKV